MFSLSYYLKRHIRAVHEGIKDYKCYACGEEFFYDSQLKTHVVMVHKQNNSAAPFEKTIDNSKISSTKEDLAEILRTTDENHHSNSEKLKTDIVVDDIEEYKGQIFQCDSCNSSFINETYLQSHKEHMHKVHQCDSCDEKFDFLYLLKKHVKSVHSTMGQKI